MSDSLSEKQFEQLIDETAADIRTLNRHNINTYRRVGERVMKLTENPGNYGNHTVEAFCEKLSERSGFTLKASSVYVAARLFEQIGNAGFDKAVEGNMAWRNLMFLSSRSLDGAKRTELLDKAVTGKLEQSKLRDAVRQAVAVGSTKKPKVQTRAAKDSGKASIAAVSGVVDLLSSVSGKLRGVEEAVEAICKGDSEANMKKANSLVGEIKEWIETLTEQWEKFNKKAVKAFSTVAEVLKRK